MTTRRDFLKSSTLIGFGATVPGFLGRTARAAETTQDRILVVVQLTGGNDGLNTVIPDHELYTKYRPTIAIPKRQRIRVQDRLGLHPSLAAFGKLLQNGEAAIVQGVGYPNPDQSHFRSMDIWQAGSTANSLTEGWIGKALKVRPMTSFHLAAENESAPLALAGAPARVPSIASLEDFQLKFAAADRGDKTRQKKLLEDVARATEPAPGLLDFVRRTAVDTYATTDRLAAIGKSDTPKAAYPTTPFASRLKLAAQLIDAGIGARIFYVSLDGFDTHAGQGGVTGAHASLLTTLSEGLSAFYQDLKHRGHSKRLCIMTFSEFGRRAKENGSAGTDHGSGAPMLLMGGNLKTAVVGDHPDLDALEEGNLKHSIDFRQVYASVLTDWLGLDSTRILGMKYEPLALFRDT